MDPAALPVLVGMTTSQASLSREEKEGSEEERIRLDAGHGKTVAEILLSLPKEELVRLVVRAEILLGQR